MSEQTTEEKVAALEARIVELEAGKTKLGE